MQVKDIVSLIKDKNTTIRVDEVDYDLDILLKEEEVLECHVHSVSVDYDTYEEDYDDGNKSYTSIIPALCINTMENEEWKKEQKNERD